MAGRVRFTQKVRAAFLAELRVHGNVRLAAEAANISRTAIYKRKETDEAFDADWEEALDEAADRLEEEARRRAVDGVMEPRVLRDRVFRVTKYSDQLLMFLLRGARPNKFRERVSVDAHVKQRGPTVVRHQIDDPSDLEEVVAILQDAGVLPAPPDPVTADGPNAQRPGKKKATRKTRR